MPQILSDEKERSVLVGEHHMHQHSEFLVSIKRSNSSTPWKIKSVNFKRRSQQFKVLFVGKY